LATLLITLCFAGASARYLLAVGVTDPNYHDAGVWLNEHTSKAARIATVETGTIGWYCDRNIIDLVGLTTPQNARYTAKADFASWIAEKPDYVVVHPANPFPWERVALASPDYEYVPIHFDKVFILRRKP
jgi:hypothetical protein